MDMSQGGTTSFNGLLHPSKFPQTTTTSDGCCTASLTYHPISSDDALRETRCPAAGANVMFLGTTRDYFGARKVSRLSYSAYPALALKSLLSIAMAARSQFGLEKVYIQHRLGTVDVEQESIAVAVSAGHRAPAWKGAEEVLEKCKEKAEIWKLEQFEGQGNDGEWRANEKSTSTDTIR